MYSAPTALDASEFHAYIIGTGTDVRSPMYRMVATYMYRLRHEGVDNRVRVPQIPSCLVGMRGMQHEQQRPMAHFLERRHHRPVEIDQCSLLGE
jgi:hypothetical protein